MGIYVDACRDVTTCASCLRASCGELLNRCENTPFLGELLNRCENTPFLGELLNRCENTPFLGELRNRCENTPSLHFCYLLRRFPDTQSFALLT
jgi:hypothetical protein